jgi:hypothetical protein
MKTFVIFIIIIIVIYFYLTHYHKVELYNILDVMHSAFIRQLSFEIIPFIVLFGFRDVQFINISSTNDFFNSVIGRSMMGMVGFTLVSYLVTSASPNKINVQHNDKDNYKDDKDDYKDDKDDIKDDIKEDHKDDIKDNNNINSTLIFEKYQDITKNNKI